MREWIRETKNEGALKMPSEFAWRIAEQSLNGSGLRPAHIKALKKETMHIADAELQEVRDVLEGLAIRKDFGDGQPCWCYKTQWDASPRDDPHASSCQRARALSDRLEVK